MRRLVSLKAELDLNVKLASPLDFLPELPGWRDRSRSRYRTGNVTVLDFDPYSQALSKIQRGFEIDRADVGHMLASGLVKPDRLRSLFDEIEGELFGFPAIDAAKFRAKLELALTSPG